MLPIPTPSSCTCISHQKQQGRQQRPHASCQKGPPLSHHDGFEAGSVGRSHQQGHAFALTACTQEQLVLKDSATLHPSSCPPSPPPPHRPLFHPCLRISDMLLVVVVLRGCRQVSCAQYNSSPACTFQGPLFAIMMILLNSFASCN